MKTYVAFLTVVVLISTALADEPMFNSSIHYLTGIDYHRQPTTADFNGDGYLDLAAGVTNWDNEYDSLSILLNNGGGTFQPAIRIAAGKDPYSIAADDFDNDSDIDMAVINRYSNNLMIFLNDGSCNFTQTSIFDLDEYPKLVVSADFDLDGAIDLAIDRSQDDNFTILYGLGDGSFPDEISYGAGTHKPFCVADFNNDDKTDIALAPDDADSIAILINLGNRIFQEPAYFDIAGFPMYINTGDFNNDDAVDIAVSADEFSIYFNDGNGAFQFNESFILDGHNGIAVSDFNDDGYGDIAVGCSYPKSKLTVIVNDGTGSFSVDDVYDIGGGTFVLAADLNYDSYDDLVVSAQGSNLSALFNNGDGTFPKPDEYLSENNWLCVSADFDNNYYNDIVLVSPQKNYLDMYYNNGNGVFDAPIELQLTEDCWFADAVDINGDRNMDLAVIDWSWDLSFMLNDGNGNFQEHNCENINTISMAAFGDFDGDDDIDVVTDGMGSSVFVYSNNGDLTFQNELILGDPHDNVYRISSADLDNDDDLDLAITMYKNDPPGDAVQIAINNGLGHFEFSNHFEVDHSPIDFCVVDFDSDGYLDIATANYDDHNISVLISNGDATFQSAVHYPVGSRPSAIQAADFDGDTDIDLAVNSQRDDIITVLLNDNDGIFSEIHHFGSQEFPQDLTAMDFDGDRDIDLASLSAASLLIIFNQTDIALPGYEYLLGDVNMLNGEWPPSIIGSDVTYLVNYFRGMNEPCYLAGFWASADVNGDCNIIGSDVTKLVNYFRGISFLDYCPDFEPNWPPLPYGRPSGWPNCE